MTASNAEAQQAYTLIEFLITLSLITIMAMLCIPALKSLSDHASDYILQAQLNELLNHARIQARHGQLPLVICHSQSQRGCDGEWRDGLILFVDRDTNGIVRQREDIITGMQLDARAGTLYFRGYPFYRLFLRMIPDEWVSSDNGMFWYCHKGASWPTFAVVVNHSGIPRTVYPDHQGAIYDSERRRVRCI